MPCSGLPAPRISTLPFATRTLVRIKYSKSSGFCKIATERGFLRVEVDDNGPGIPVSERENVFRPFYRIDPARTQNTGHSGLGLAIARDIARSHGGDIVLGESSIGGLRAVIRVPL